MLWTNIPVQTRIQHVSKCLLSNILWQPNSVYLGDTAPQSPTVDANTSLNVLNSRNSPNKTADFPVVNSISSNGRADPKDTTNSTENFPNFSNFLEIDKARAYCQGSSNKYLSKRAYLAHPNDVENLLKFSEMVRAIRTADSDSLSKNRRPDGSTTGRIPLAVVTLNFIILIPTPFLRWVEWIIWEIFKCVSAN